MRCRGESRFVFAIATLLLSLAACSTKDGAESAAGESTGGTASRAGGTAVRRQAPDPRPKVVIETSAGIVTVELDREHAPLTVDNFLTYVDQQHYNGTVFHQVVDGYIILGGGYSSELTERPTHPAIRNEAHNGLQNVRGTIAMARQLDAIDSATSQFFINLVDNPMLDHRGRDVEQYGYCVFGKIVGGLDVVERISKVDVHDTDDFDSLPVEQVVVKSIRLLR